MSAASRAPHVLSPSHFHSLFAILARPWIPELCPLDRRIIFFFDYPPKICEGQARSRAYENAWTISILGSRGRKGTKQSVRDFVRIASAAAVLFSGVAQRLGRKLALASAKYCCKTGLEQTCSATARRNCSESCKACHGYRPTMYAHPLSAPWKQICHVDVPTCQTMASTWPGRVPAPAPKL